jgi:hypothetical protein
MHSAEYYRRQAARARRMADLVHQPEFEEMLRTAAQDYEDIAEDIDLGAIEIRHPELLPQRNHR